MHHVIEFDEQCKSCRGSGLYVGIAERDGAAVVCHTCAGTGCHHVKIKYDDFEGRKQPKESIERVFAANPDICIGVGDKLALEDFGGIPFEDWNAGKPFPVKSENRRFTCPAWWYQAVDYEKKPCWDDEERRCGWGAFSACKYFDEKDGCWRKWDREYGDG